jgi:hypothetical protein
VSPPLDEETLIRPDSPLVDAIVADAILNLRPWRRKAPPDPPTSGERLQSSRELVASVLNACFWASLAREEGRPVLTGVTFASPEELADQFSLARPEPLTHESLVRFGTVSGESYKLGIHEHEGKPHIWGFLGGSAPYWVTVRFDRPGRLAVILEGAGILCLFEHGRIQRPQSHAVANPWNVGMQLRDLVGPSLSPAEIAGLTFVAKEMWRLGHGGTLLVVREADWERDLYVPHRLDESSQGLLARLGARVQAVQGPENDQLKQALLFGSEQAAKQVAAFTRIDGAAVIGRDLRLFGFGARITTEDVGDVHPAVMRRTIYEDVLTPADWSDLGGTRHQSAARFVAASRDSVAFVSSQDGRLSAFAWRDGPKPGHLEWLQGLEGLAISE